MIGERRLVKITDRETFIWCISRNLDSLVNRLVRFAHPIATKLFIIDMRQFDVDVNYVEQGQELRFWYLVTTAGAQGKGNTNIYPGHSCNREDFNMVNLICLPKT